MEFTMGVLDFILSCRSVFGIIIIIIIPTPIAARSKTWVCGRLLAGIVGPNSERGHGCLSVVSVVCCQIEVSATGRSLIQRSPKPTMTVEPREESNYKIYINVTGLADTGWITLA
jgi:hypothetical protein